MEDSFLSVGHVILNLELDRFIQKVHDTHWRITSKSS